MHKRFALQREVDVTGVSGTGTVEWTWTGVVENSSIGGGSKAKLMVEGRFHRQNRQGEAGLPARYWAREQSRWVEKTSGS